MSSTYVTLSVNSSEFGASREICNGLSNLNEVNFKEVAAFICEEILKVNSKEVETLSDIFFEYEIVADKEASFSNNYVSLKVGLSEGVEQLFNFFVDNRMTDFIMEAFNSEWQSFDSGYPEAIKYIWRNGRKDIFEFNPDVSENVSKETVNFVAACKKNDVKLVEKLVKQGIDPLVCHEYYPGFLHAVKNDSMDVVEYLMESGLDINLDAIDCEENRVNALIVAIKEDNNRMTHFLINNGINVNFKDSKGDTALSWSLLELNFCAAKKLIDNNADINGKNKYGYPYIFKLMLELNEVGQELDCINNLFDYFVVNGLDINISNNGYNLLMKAVSTG
ncbi:ankyrin repeat domain-containing protein, partial [Zooshikella harenae]